jgi:hypothetical protein
MRLAQGIPAGRVESQELLKRGEKDRWVARHCCGEGVRNSVESERLGSGHLKRFGISFGMLRRFTIGINTLIRCIPCCPISISRVKVYEWTVTEWRGIASASRAPRA